MTLTAGVLEDLGDIPPGRPIALDGRVVDAAGRPVANALVRWDVDDADAANRATTDEDGVFRGIQAAAGGLVALQVGAAGFVRLRRTVKADEPVLLTLARGGVVWGEVVDAAGAPRLGAKVRVLDARGEEAATTDADALGLFSAVVAPGRCEVRVEGDAATVVVEEKGDVRVRLVVRTR